LAGEIVERIPDETGDASKAGALTGRRDLYPEVARVAAPVEVDSQPGPRGFRDAPELVSQCLWFCPVEPTECADWDRAIAGWILGTDGEGSVHGVTCKLLGESVLRSWLTKPLA
jgi:hypothetical protein